MALRFRSALNGRTALVVGTILAMAGCVPGVQPGPVVPPAPPVGLQTVFATDAAGNQVLAGSFRGELTVNGGKLTSVGGTDIFVVKTGPSGFGLEGFGGPGEDAATGVAIDPDGTIYIVGTFQGKATFGQYVVDAEVKHPGQRAVFVARLLPDGKVDMAKRIASSNVPTQVSVAVQPDHSILIGVSATGTVSSGRGDLRLAGESAMLDHLSAHLDKLDLPPGQMFMVRSLTLGCAHSPCKTGGPLNSLCGQYGCVAAVCASDSYCCTTSWIQRCVNEMPLDCPRRCDCSQVRTAGMAFYPDADPCTVAIYSEDSYCCDWSWDSLCVAETFLPVNIAACNSACQ
jgi:hypothetical protein